MSQSELDSVLGEVENPIRRRIMARLSQEPNYQLQLSKELGVSQQLVAKHLGSMEDAGLVGSVFEDSPRGPQRKEYLLKKSISVTVDLAPNLFRARVFSFGAMPGLDSENAQVIAKINEVLRYPDEAAKLGPLAQIINEVDRKLKETEEQRAVLLYLRNLALREAALASTSLDKQDRLKVLHYIMKEQHGSSVDISTSLGIQRKVVGGVLEEIEREFSESN
ncbi:MAG: ArsR family transcriptional regulator [Nitrososphaerales archaeon]|nr:ArsR family transcriptional regulator [Nitrososphaerales archaeon]